ERVTSNDNTKITISRLVLMDARLTKAYIRVSAVSLRKEVLKSGRHL
ncbi:unnamed protein product, partial [Heterotrigona itama]